MGIVHVIIDWLHLLATVVWIGGMAFNIWVLRPSLSTVEPRQRVKIASAVLKRFIYLAWLSIVTLFITGVFLGPTTSGVSLTTDYGILLITKHTIVIAMVIIVAVISFVIFPRFKTLLSDMNVKVVQKEMPSPELSKLLGRIVLLVKLNLTLGIVVLLFTAALQHI